MKNALQRTLDAVVYVCDKPRSKLDGKRFAGRDDAVAVSEPRRLLIDLNRRPVSVHFNDFADEPRLADSHDVEHVGVSHATRDDKRT